MNEPLILSIAEVEIEAAAGDKPARVAVEAYSGGEMRVPGWGTIVIESAALDLPTQVPLLANHTNAVESIAGHGRPAANKSGVLTIEGSLSRSTAAGKLVLDLAREGVKLGASVGVEPGKVERLRSGDTAKVNGRTVTAGASGLTIIRGGRLREVSIVAVPADDTTAVSVAASKGKAMSTETEPTTEERELDRVRQLHAAADKYLRDYPTSTSTIEAKLSAAVEGDTTPAAFELDLLRSTRPIGPDNRPRTNGSGPTGAGVLEASVLLAAGVSEKFIGAEYGEQIANAALSREHRGASLHSILHACIRAAGKHADPGRMSSDTLRTAFEASASLRASGYSTFSLPAILSSVQNKAMLAAYQSVRTTWPLFVRVDSVKDFKLARRFRLVGVGEFEEIGPAGELKHISLTEQDYANQLKTHGAILSITRQHLIDDDIGALSTVPMKLGRMSAIKIEKAVYELLLSNPGSFFDAGAGNSITDVLDIDGLTVAEETMLDLTDNNGDPVMIEPQVLLVPSTLAVTGRKLVRDTAIVVAGNTDVVLPGGNPFAGRFTAASTPWLNSQNLSGSSDTLWYLLTGPNDAAIMSIAFLNGQALPTVESADADFSTLGVQSRAYHDFGVAMHDPRGGVRSTGAG